MEFTRSGVSGTLIVAADHFDLHAKLGFLLGAFAKTIEAEIMKNLDGLLSQAAAKKPAAAKKKAAKVSAKFLTIQMRCSWTWRLRMAA